MRLLLPYIRLIRPLNLAIIVFTLYLVRLLFSLLSASYPHYHLGTFIDNGTYALFSAAYCFMAAAGYIINDYYDVPIDIINKPDKVVIGKQLSKKSGVIAYLLLALMGISAGGWSSVQAGVPWAVTLFLFYFAALWFYSYRLKSTFLLGNLLVSLCIALVPVGASHIELRYATLSIDLKKVEWIIMLCIALFAFLSTLIREIAKDAEDAEGDAQATCNTLPIVIGLPKTKGVILFLLLIVNIALCIIEYQFYIIGRWYSLLYFLLLIQIPFLIMLYFLKTATIPKNFHCISTLLKVWMLTGMLYLFYVAYAISSVSFFFATLFNT
jgi:4-hydroxybenzoate polyprenyltransferase